MPYASKRKRSSSRGRMVKRFNRGRTFRTVRRRVPAAPRGLSNMRKMIKNVQLSQAETNYKSLAVTSSGMNHDKIYAFPLWGPLASIFPTQGTGDDQRVGDRITASSVKIRLCMDVPWDRKNVKVKLYYLPYNSDQGDPTSYSSLFNNITGNSLLDPINFKRWKGIKYLGMYRPQDKDASVYQTLANQQGAPGATHLATNTASIVINKTLKMNRKCWFQDGSDQQPSNLRENGTLLVLPYATTNTAITDTIIEKMEGAYTLYYKDL
ncbi:MAG: putative capsid protein [Cressdnaviricota sp.]|nr:MAG: putative capsid protein [Cressdnaviricota sp.]